MKSKVIKILATTICVIMLQGCSPNGPETSKTTAEQDTVTTLTVLTSPSGSGPYVALATAQTYMSDFSDTLRLDVEETPGFNFNVKYISDHPEEFKSTIIGTGSVLNWAAATGHEPFYEEPLSVMTDFKTVMVLGLSFNAWVSLDASIEEPKDFVGKRVGIGLLTQNEWGMHQRMLLDAWGLTDRLESLDVLGSSQNITALLDGRTDVGTLFGISSADGSITVVTAPHRELEASNRSWRYVSVPAEMIEETRLPFRVVNYPPETLPNQPEPASMFGDLLLLSAHKSMPTEVVKEFVRVFLENQAQIAEYHGFFRPLTPATMSFGLADDLDSFHPGAIEAFKDAGLLPGQ